METMEIIQGGGMPSMSSARGNDSSDSEEALKLKLPTSFNFIVGNEFCERFSYYGMRTVLPLYLVDHLKQSEKQATESLHLFIVACYMTPLLGAFISDSYIGKYRTILYLSIVYCLGNWAMAASALHSQASHSASVTLLGLGLIALGTGGIKPCVSAFGGDQIELLYPPGPATNTLLRRFFSVFYWTINAAAVLSTLVTPIIRSYSTYAWAFAVPAWLMMLSLALFYLGRGGYKHQPPGGNVVAHVVGVIWAAIMANPEKVRDYTALEEIDTQAPEVALKAKPPAPNAPPQTKPIEIGFPGQFPKFPGGNSLRTGSIFLRGTSPGGEPDNETLLSGTENGSEAGSSQKGGAGVPLPRPPSRPNVHEINAPVSPPSAAAADQSLPSVNPPVQLVAKAHWLDAAKPVHGSQHVEDVKVLLRVLLLFVPMPLFWSLFDQQSSTWVFQARRMDGRLPFGFVIEPDQMQVLNAVFILIMIPLFDRGIYPSLERRGVSLRPIRRMVVGMFVTALAFVLSAIVQMALDHKSPLPEEGVTSSLTSASPYNATMGLADTGRLFDGGDLGRPGHEGEDHRISMLWQIPQYFVLTASEVMFSVTGFELAYSQAPSNMTSVVSSAWLLSVAAGNLVTVLVVGIIGNRLSPANEFLFFAGGCIVAMMALQYVGQNFAYAVTRRPSKSSIRTAPSEDVEEGL